ncbi:MAG: LON peptidase substrate-binding domain-containing protein [Sandaracinaceae bacterium]
MSSASDAEILSETELAALPVFPLPNVVLFPGADLSLHLFEPRYRAMMERCVSDGPMAMAIARLRPGYEADYEGHPPIEPIAGGGRIMDWRRRPDGRFDLLLRGVGRLSLEEIPRERDEYRVAHARLLDDRVSHPELVADAHTALLSVLPAFLGVVRECAPGFEWDLGDDLAPGELADRLAHRVVVHPLMRQRLLETLDVKVRLTLLREAILELTASLRGKPEVLN